MNAKPIRIDCDFPGGNILVDGIDGDTVRLRQDIRTTTEWWFYWNFRIRGAAGRTVRFVFTNGDVFNAAGPCFSRDGVAWQWLGREIVRDNAFSHTFPADCDTAFFPNCIPYVQSNLDRFLAAHPRVQRSVLTKSEKGREVERLTLTSSKGTWLVPLVARNHACESMADYALEGIIEHWLGDEPTSRFLQEHVDLQIVPFMDKDGVEDGDQGKLRAPHDHNRDWSDRPIYASVRAVQQQLPTWRGRPAMSLDLHCPWVRDGRNEAIFLVGIAPPQQTEQTRFGAILARTQHGELRYDPKDDIALDEGWNTGPADTSQAWIGRRLAFAFAGTLEIAYGVAGGKIVTAENVRAFGRDLGRAIGVFVRQAAPCAP